MRSASTGPYASPFERSSPVGPSMATMGAPCSASFWAMVPMVPRGWAAGTGAEYRVDQYTNGGPAVLRDLHAVRPRSGPGSGWLRSRGNASRSSSVAYTDTPTALEGAGHDPAVAAVVAVPGNHQHTVAHGRTEVPGYDVGNRAPGRFHEYPTGNAGFHPRVLVPTGSLQGIENRDRGHD